MLIRIFALALLIAFTAWPDPPALAVSRAKRCRQACRDAIVACAEARVNRPRRCKRQIVRRCKREGVATCATPTTTTTLPASAPPPPTTTLARVTSTTTTTIPWNPTASIRWLNGLPPTVAAGASVPLALEVLAPASTIEGRMLACNDDVRPEHCTEDHHALIGVDPATFEGPPGRFEFIARSGIPVPTEQDTRAYLLARIFLVDGARARRGPYYGPLTQARVAIAGSPLLLVEPQQLVFDLTTANPSQTTHLRPQTRCGRPLRVEVSVDVPWLTVTDFGDGTLSVTADAAGVDPSGSPFQGSVTLVFAGPYGHEVTVPVSMKFAALRRALSRSRCR